jgi:hypothetical protein
MRTFIVSSSLSKGEICRIVNILPATEVSLFFVRLRSLVPVWRQLSSWVDPSDALEQMSRWCRPSKFKDKVSPDVMTSWNVRFLNSFCDAMHLPVRQRKTTASFTGLFVFTNNGALIHILGEMTWITLQNMAVASCQRPELCNRSDSDFANLGLAVYRISVRNLHPSAPPFFFWMNDLVKLSASNIRRILLIYSLNQFMVLGLKSDSIEYVLSTEIYQVSTRGRIRLSFDLVD